MGRAVINYDFYKVKAYLDSNIILECRPLSELPWHEIDPEGPILALITPTAIKEIDSKKQDGRIGKRAREFNRLIASVAAGGPPVILRQTEPRVEIALSRAVRIPWDQHDDLDPNDGDSCIVAEVIHDKDIVATEKLIVSHDIKPIAFASNYDVKTLHISDSWLRQAEPHPKDKEILKLNQQLKQYKEVEPAFEIDLSIIDKEPVSLIRIEDLSNTERVNIENRILELNPPEDQGYSPLGIVSINYDYSYDKRFESYKRSVPAFMEGYAQRLEQVFNQVSFKLKIINIGKVQAENLLIEVCIKNGWLHDRFAFVSPQGPPAPIPRNNLLPPINIRSIVKPHVGRHAFEYKEAPKCGQKFSVMCEDFRNRQEYVFEGVAYLDARAVDPTEITVAVTASNYSGTADAIKSIDREIEKLHASKLIDLNTLTITAPIPMRKLIDNGDIEAIDLKTLYGNEDDD